jgi:hypothetical protein
LKQVFVEIPSAKVEMNWCPTRAKVAQRKTT